MTALSGLPGRRAVRAIHPVLALAVALTIGSIVATRLSPTALADPPAGWQGGWIELTPDRFGSRAGSARTP